MYLSQARFSTFHPQAEGPEVVDARQHGSAESAYENVEANAYRPALERDAKPKSDPKFKPKILPKPGVGKQQIYIEVELNPDATTPCKPKVASKAESDEKVIYAAIDPDQTRNYKKPPPKPHKPLAAQGVAEARVPDVETMSTAKLALAQSINGMVRDFSVSRQGGLLKTFKSHDSYGRGAAVKHLLGAMFQPSVTGMARQLAVAHGRMTPQARDEQLFNDGFDLTQRAIGQLPPDARLVVKRHLGDAEGLQASLQDQENNVEKREKSTSATSVRDGIVHALLMFIAEAKTTQAPTRTRERPH